ncbi:MAG: TolC family protein [Campylobacterota bacterium]|nr:TolC family protein [Campylobacterota bacterium]
MNFFYKLLLFVIFSSSLLYGDYDDYNNKIEETLKNDFDRNGIIWDRDENLLKFKDNKYLFKNGKSELNRTLKNTLDDIFPKYFKILLKYKDDIKKVLVKGHASSNMGSATNDEEKYQLNLILSQERADNFLAYIKRIDHLIVKKNRNWIKDIFIPIGISSSEVIFNEKKIELRDASRRVEIQIIFKDGFVPSSEDNSETNTESIEDKTIYLSTYVKRMLQENPTLESKRYYIKSIQKDIDLSRALFKPTVTLNYGKKKFFESDQTNHEYEESADITLRYNIFNGFKDWDDIDIKKHSYNYTKHENKKMENEYIYKVVEAWLEIQQQDEILGLIVKNIDDYSQWFKKEQIKFQNGMTSLKNFSKIESRYKVKSVNFVEFKRLYEDSVAKMARVVDFDEQDINFFEKVNPTSKYFYNIPISLEKAEITSPDVLQAEENVKLYHEKLDQASVSFYPSIDFVAKKSILDESFENKNDDLTTKETYVGIEAKIQLYNAGKDSLNYRKKLNEYKEKLYKRKEVSRDIRYVVTLAHNNYSLLKNKEKYFKTIIEKREKELIGATYDYEFMKIDGNTLLDVDDNLYAGQKQYIDNKYELLRAKYKLLQDIGIIKEVILDEK